MQLKAALLSAAVAAVLLPAASAVGPQDVSALLGLNALLGLSSGPHAEADLAVVAAAADPLPADAAKCYADTMLYVAGWNDGGKFMIDAFGKVPSALLETGLFSYGSYSECLRERANWTLPEPQYCLNTFKSFPGKYGTCLPKSCNEDALPKAWPLIVKTLTDLASPGLYDMLKAQAPWFLNVVPHCARPSEWGAGAILVMTVISIILATVAFATGLDYYRSEFAAKKHDEKGTDTERLLSAEGAHADGDKPQVATAVTVKSESAWKTDSKESLLSKAIGGFSLFRSLPRLIVAEGGNSHTGALNGIRALSMFWVLLAHVFFYSTLIGDDNIRDFPELGDRWPYQILLNAFLSVDTFFFLSGFLVCYGALMTLHRTKRFSFPLYIIARVLRILPTYALMLFIYWKLQGFFGQGPTWYSRQTNPNCDKYWWTNMLFINNFEPGDVNKECMGWTWYLAVDFQCYFVAPLIFLPLYHKPRVGEAILGLFIVITTTIAGLLTVFYDLPATTIVKSVSGNNYSTIMYVKPYTRFAPYGIGMLVAYLFVKLSGRLDPPVNNPTVVPADAAAADPKAAAHHAKPKLRELTPELLAGPYRLAAWYAVGGVLLTSSLFGTYSLHQARNLALAAALQDKPMADPWPLASRFFYNAYGHLAWSMGLGMILWPILAGRARFLSWFLNNTIWGVFAKLTFVAYLAHEMIVDVYFNNLGAPWHYGDVLNFGVFLGALTASYTVAAITWLCFEGPMGGVVKILLEVIAGKGKRGSK